MNFFSFDLVLAKNALFWGQNLDFYNLISFWSSLSKVLYIFLLIIILQAIPYIKNIELIHFEKITFDC